MATKKSLKKTVKTKTIRQNSPKHQKGKPKVALVEASKDELLGKYCNFGVIRHTNREFILDFIWTLDDHSILASRLITSPQHAKMIHKALGNNIRQFEKKHGKISTDKLP